MSNVTNLDRYDRARPHDESNASRSAANVARPPKWPLRIFLVAAVLTAAAMIAVLFSPLYPNRDVGTYLAFAVAFGFLILFLTAFKAVKARGKFRAR